MRLLHPLAGARFAVANRSIRAHGGTALFAAPARGVMVASHILRFPSCFLETRRAERLAAVSPDMPDPVFVVGHWRSGTTLLANLMSFDEGYFFPTLVEAVSPHDFFPSPLEKLSRIWLPKLFPQLRPMDAARVPMRQPFPQEDEMALASMGAPSFFNALYFPSVARKVVMREVFFDGASQDDIAEWRNAQSGFVRKLALLHPDKRPLLKNPAHTARLQQLQSLYPGAKYILLHRDRSDVTRSMQKLFERLWPLLALQRYDLSTLPQLVHDIYDRMTICTEQDWPRIPEENRIEIAFDELLAAPLETVATVHNWLEQPMSAAHGQAVKSYMQAYGSK